MHMRDREKNWLEDQIGEHQIKLRSMNDEAIDMHTGKKKKEKYVPKRKTVGVIVSLGPGSG